MALVTRARMARSVTDARRMTRITARGFHFFAVVALLNVALLALSVAPALAAVPINDDFADATVVNSLPFGETVDATGATSETGEPFPACTPVQTGTTWYSFTPATGAYIRATSAKNGFMFVGAVYTGSSLATLQEVTCNIGAYEFQAAAGTTYHIQVVGAGVFDFELEETAPPARPDARIRHLGGVLRGNNLYNDDAAFQRLFPSVPAGESRRIVISIQNDNTAADAFTVGASGAAATGFAVHFYEGWPLVDVTSSIEAGTFTTPTLQPGEAYRIRAVVNVGFNAGTGEAAALNRRVTATSIAQASKLDAVGFLVFRRV